MTDKKTYDRTYAIVDLDRIENNLRLCKKKLRKGMSFCAVIKMDAYGHGMVEVGKAVEEERIFWYLEWSRKVSILLYLSFRLCPAFLPWGS